MPGVLSAGFLANALDRQEMHYRIAVLGALNVFLDSDEVVTRPQVGNLWYTIHPEP